MKLNLDVAHVERSNAFISSFFDIGNKRVIMNILRSKMYSNPIRTICQEIASNARDAHKEVGKETLPIEIKIPNKLEPFFYVRDFGPGISPDRMNTVFIFYGVSTKSNSNDEDGGYGLGAKSPFAYGDTFTIVSITPDENGILIRREYLAHIDESGLGQLTLVKEGPSDEPQGTCIIISVKEEDFESFATYTKRATSHWKVRPIIKGSQEWNWPEINAKWTGDRWELHDKTPLKRDGTDAPFALINGIPYSLNLSDIYPNGIPEDLKELNKIPLRLHFDIGEIPVTANREEIDYQPAARDYIANKIEKAVNEVSEIMSEDLVNCANLREAAIFWNTLRKTPYGCLVNANEWNGLKLKDYQEIKVPNNGTIVTHFKPSNDNLFKHKKCSKSRNIALSADTLIVEDDIKTMGIARARVAQLFEQHSPHRVILVDFLKETITTTKNGVTLTDVVYADPTKVEERKKAIHWNLVGAIKLSTIEKATPQRTPNTNRQTYKTIKLKQFNRDSQDWDEFDTNDNSPLRYYVVTAGKSIVFDKDTNLRISVSSLPAFLTYFDAILNKGKPTQNLVKTKLYGAVPSQLSKLDTSWQPFYPYALRIVAEFKLQISTELDSQYAIHRQFGHKFSPLLSNENFLKQISPKSPIHSYIEESNNVQNAIKIAEQYNRIAKLLGAELFDTSYRNVNTGKNVHLKKLYEEIVSLYPLFSHLSNAYNLSESDIDEIAAYARMKEEQKGI